MKKTRESTLIILCILSSLKESLFIFAAPFFPEQFEMRHVPELYFAPMFISYSVTLLMSSVCTANLMQKWGRAPILRIGSTLQAMSCVLIIALVWTEEPISFLILGFLGRIIEGIGAGLMQTSALAEATAQYKNEEHKVVTWIEFSEEFG
jgi:MFS family permease